MNMCVKHSPLKLLCVKSDKLAKLTKNNSNIVDVICHKLALVGTSFPAGKLDVMICVTKDFQPTGPTHYMPQRSCLMDVTWTFITGVNIFGHAVSSQRSCPFGNSQTAENPRQINGIPYINRMFYLPS